jgi:hypothetical protein
MTRSTTSQGEEAKRSGCAAERIGDVSRARGHLSLRHAIYHSGRLRRAPLPNHGHVAPLRRAQERMASIAWAIRIATLAAMMITNSQVITFISTDGVERAQQRTVKNNPRKSLTSAVG